MRPPAQPTRYALVPKTPSNPGVRRYSLTRLAASPRSALGVNCHERLDRDASQFRQA
ncbi:MAG: hypothetical protein WKF29_01545 [Thermoleophilaceae bacterium]